MADAPVIDLSSFAVGMSRATRAMTTFAEPACTGMRDVQLRDAPAVREFISIERACSGALGYARTPPYRVMAVSGDGPYVVTLDRPLTFSVLRDERVAIGPHSSVGANNPDG